MNYNQLYETIIEGILEQEYAVVDQFFTSEEVSQLRKGLEDAFNLSQFKKSAIGNKVDEKIVDAVRGDYILWLDEQNQTETTRVFFNKVQDFVTYINSTCFLGITTKEFHYAVYPEGTFYKRHLDVFQNDKRRRLSLVCYLNDENWLPEYGGELVIYKENETSTIFPEKGRVVIFDSQKLEHEVMPVKRKRYSITGWLKTS